MNFAHAIAQSEPPANSAYQAGLQALGSDSKFIRCSTPRRIAGSINVDATLSSARPNEPRWDYGIGWKRHDGEEAIWVEVHPASTAEVSRMIAKYQWLRRWLRTDAQPLNSITHTESQPFYWIATHGVHITKTGSVARQLAPGLLSS